MEDFKGKVFALSNALGASGREHDVAKLAAEYLKPYVDSVFVDRLGNVVGTKSCGLKNAKKILLDAHIDQVSLLVTSVTDDGFLKFIPLSVDQRILPAANVVVATESGLLKGVISNIPPHMLSSNDAAKAYKFDNLVIDIGFGCEKAKELVKVGDFVYFDNCCVDVGGLIVGKAMDDRACFMSLVHAMELLKDKQLTVDLVIVGSTKEEVGAHGAVSRMYTDKPDLFIVVDVTHAKTPDAPKCFEFGSPVIEMGIDSTPLYVKQVLEVARAKNITTQLNIISSGSGTNGNRSSVVELATPGIVISVPLRYMHTPLEAIKLDDLKLTGKLISEYLLNINNRFN